MAAVVQKKGRGRKALKDLSSSEVNISESSSPGSGVRKEVGEGVSALVSPKNAKKEKSKSSSAGKNSFEDELLQLQGRLQQLQLEKEKTEELLKQRDELLKQKDEEIENRGKEHEKLQEELKKMQKLKEFKPTMSFPLIKSLRGKEEDKDEKKKNKGKKGTEKRKPCPAYVSWCKDQWNDVKKENPGADFKEVSNVLGTKWKALSAEEKKPYEDKYQQEKEAYLEVVKQDKREKEALKLLEEEQMQKTAMELLEQYLQFQQEVEKEGKKVRKEKDPLKPKQPMSAFFLFSKERRETLLQEKKTILEISKIAGEEWKNMTEEQKAPYEEIAKKLKENYNQEMEIYKQKKTEEAATIAKEEEEHIKVLKQEALQLLRKKEKTDNMIKETKQNRIRKKKEKEEQVADPNRPKRPPSSFLLFSKEARKQLMEERPGIPNTTLNAMISVKWKEMSEGEKKTWNDKAAEGLNAYKKELEEYNKASMDNKTTPKE
ncbi:high mobility group B protein 13-like isoform X1 [Curcuma longa]|uniref:high mobility group B protein 13-like isoform X1 n=1 Tax=Curcuma longa TaxID=136217 RepID=UPI003D9E21D8